MGEPKHPKFDFEAVLSRIELKPELLAPCTNKEAAALLKMAPKTLENLRSAGKGPPGWVDVPGVGRRYRSKLDILEWWWAQHGQAATEPSKRGAAQ